MLKSYMIKNVLSDDEDQVHISPESISHECDLDVIGLNMCHLWKIPENHTMG